MIVHVGNYDPNALDGVSTTIVGQCDALLKKGVEIEVWYFVLGVDDIQRKTAPNGLQIFSIPRFRNPLVAALALPRISKRWISERISKVELFHLHSVFSPPNNRVSRLGIPYVVTPNGGWGEQVLRGRNAVFKSLWIRIFEKSLWRDSKFIQGVSRLEASSLESLPEIGKIVYIPNGVDVPAATALFKTRESQNYWLFLGRLAIEQKGLDILLNAYAKANLTVSLPSLLLVGPDFRGGMAKLKALAGDLGIASKVKFAGPLVGGEKKQVLAQAALFLHPSRWEGLPLSILEALAHGVPCLVSPETGVADWILDNQCGWSVAGDVDLLAASLVGLAQSPVLIREKSINTRIAVERDFSWNSVADNLLGAYRSLGGFE